MSDAVVRKAIRQALSGRSAHVEVEPALEGLDWEAAGSRPAEAEHSVFQLLNHMIYWQDFALAWLAGNEPPTPKHAAQSWPGAEAPADAGEWEEALGRFGKGLEEINRHAQEDDLFGQLGSKTALEILHLIATHNSYHIGQVVSLRRGLGSWPPPRGGATW